MEWHWDGEQGEAMVGKPLREGGGKGGGRSGALVALAVERYVEHLVIVLEAGGAVEEPGTAAICSGREGVREVVRGERREEGGWEGEGEGG